MLLDTKELNTITLLYVEDDKDVSNQTMSLFSKIFKKVFSCVDGQEGLDTFLENKDSIEIIVTDINMPNMDGLTMIKNINEQTQKIPVIVTTAHTDSKHLIHAIELNVDKYVPKPLQIRDLTVNIVNLVQKYRRANKLETLAKGLIKKNSLDHKTNQELQHLLNIKTQKLKYYETIIDDFVFTFKTNVTGDITEVSTKFYRYFHYDKEQILKKNIKDLKSETCEGETFQQLMLKAIHTKKAITSTQIFVKNDNSTVSFDVTMTPIYGQDSVVIGYTFYLDLV